VSGRIAWLTAAALTAGVALRLRTVPALVLAGTDDSTIPARSTRWLAYRIDGPVRQLLVPGAGHMVTLTHAAVVHAALLTLLADVEVGTDGRTPP
jgi:pimeloyl-ACP methyl ester carboxylesterase